MTMQYAARTADGRWTGAVYQYVTPSIAAYHAAHGETVVAVTAFQLAGDGSWIATEATSAEVAAQLTVTRFQARAALMQAGLLAAAEAAVAASADPLIELAWTEAVEFARTAPTIATLGAAIGLTNDQLDQLFISASTITA